MAYNLVLTQRVRELLAHIPHVEEKKMFGSIGFMVNGKLCLGVGDHPDHNMMVRVGPEHYKEALTRPHAAPAVMRGREHPGYVFLTSEAVAANKDLQYWVDLALSYNKKI
jgi:TfoX/Sxy family transcriptional regulator of competence genes